MSVRKINLKGYLNCYNHSNLLLGLSFKENCPDIRNSKIIDLINELKVFNVLLDVSKK